MSNCSTILSIVAPASRFCEYAGDGHASVAKYPCTAQAAGNAFDGRTLRPIKCRHLGNCFHRKVLPRFEACVTLGGRAIAPQLELSKPWVTSLKLMRPTAGEPWISNDHKHAVLSLRQIDLDASVHALGHVKGKGAQAAPRPSHSAELAGCLGGRGLGGTVIFLVIV